jgi:hypothetical protein
MEKLLKGHRLQQYNGEMLERVKEQAMEIEK